MIVHKPNKFLLRALFQDNLKYILPKSFIKAWKFSMFTRYALVGFFNTAIHAISYFFLIFQGHPQKTSNLAAFLLAVSASYLLNIKFTFRAKPNIIEYIIYSVSMGSLSYFLGYIGDYLMLPSIVSFIAFCSVSLTIGFNLSKFVFVKER